MRKRIKWNILFGMFGGVAMTLLNLQPAQAVYLDDAGKIFFTSRFYTQARFRTERRRNHEEGSFTLMQHRFFVDPQLQIAAKEYFQRIPVFEQAVSYLDTLRFFFNPRFEYDGVYDYGPDTYRDKLAPRRQEGNRLSLFEVYGDTSLLNGSLNIRVGRQNLSWGETDGFRLLDQINPLDGGFGGFQIALDERRRPLTMMRVTYGLGLDVPEWNLYSTTLEFFVAPDKRLPDFAIGSGDGRGLPSHPWRAARAGVTASSVAPTFTAERERCARELGLPDGEVCDVTTQLDRPDLKISDVRWGARLLWTLNDISYSLAYQKTIHPFGLLNLQPWNKNNPNDPYSGGRTPLRLSSSYQSVHVVGASASGPVSTFPVPVLRDLTYTIFRTEIAGFLNSPQYIESRNMSLGRTIPKRDSINAVFALDHAQWLRSINRSNVFNFSVQQFFSSRLGDNEGLRSQFHVCDFRCRPQDKLSNPDDQSFLTTFSVNSTFSASYLKNIAQLVPIFVLFYDWEGSWLIQPTLQFLRDPWRFQLQYSNVGGVPRGIGALKDMDNMAIRIDYLL